MQLRQTLAPAAMAVALAASAIPITHAQTLPPVSPAPVQTREYDAQGNLRRITLAPGATPQALTTQWDRLHRPVTQTDALQHSIQLQWSAQDTLTQVTDPRGLATRYQHDGHGELFAQASPDSGATQVQRDAAGRPVRLADARGVVTLLGWDELGRLVSRTHRQPGLTDEVYTWRFDESGGDFGFGVGRLTTTTYPSGQTRWGYDALGRVVRMTQTVVTTVGAPAVVLTVQYAYDAAGRLTRITYPSGRVVEIGLHQGQPRSLGLRNDAAAALTPLVSDISWMPQVGGLGPAHSWRWHLSTGATLPHQRLFDEWGRMVRHPLGGALRDLQYDSADRVLAFTHLDASLGQETPASRALNQTFGYDATGRLTEMTTPAGVWRWAWDASGNRTQTQLPGSQGPVSNLLTTEATSNRLLSATHPAQTFAYDARGSLVLQVHAGTQRQWEISLSGRISAFQSQPLGGWPSSRMFYGHDAHGLRVFKRQVSIPLPPAACAPLPRCPASPPPRVPQRVFLYDLDGQLLGEYGASASDAMREIVWLQGMPLVLMDGPASSTTVAYVHTDHLDTPRVVLDRAGRQRWSWVSEPFGDSPPQTNPLGLGDFTLNLRMPGQFFDAESGLMYNWHRSYDAGVGRYTQSDPIGLAGGINTYAYALGNPVSNVDPQGLAVCTFSFSRGTMVCTSDRDRTRRIELPVTSGNNNIAWCRDNPLCALDKGVGPAPKGCYRWGGVGRSGGNRRNLIPIEGPAAELRKHRTDLQTHACVNPWGPTADSGSRPCSEGCLVSTPPHIDKLNDLIDAEPGSILCVED